MEGLFFEGLFLQASLIFALGAQNIFVLESGLKKQHPLAISFVCFFCDLTLILIGVAGAGTLFSSFSQLKIIIGIIGVIFMFQYGISKIFVPQSTFSEHQYSLIKQGLKRSVFLAITFSIFNPHAYLDAFILIGGYSTKYSLLSDRLLVGLGAAFFSLLWFLFLSSASSLMKPVFSNAKSFRLLSTCSGLVLLVLSLKLGIDVFGWIMNGPHSPLVVNAFSYPLPSGLMYSSILY
jgi:L-lysine exporter family protein LysE/ArgO